MYVWDENKRNKETQHRISFDLINATGHDTEKVIVVGTYTVFGKPQLLGRSFSRRDFCLRWWNCVGVFGRFDVLEWDFSTSRKPVAHVRGSGWHGGMEMLCDVRVFGVSFEEDARGMVEGRMRVGGWELVHVGGGRWELC